MDLTNRICDAVAGLHKPTAKQLQWALQKMNLSADDVTALVPEPGALPYGRHVLFRNGDCEVILIHLPAGSETYIHDHGYSVGCACVLEGKLRNAVYRLDSCLYAVEAGETVVHAGQFIHSPHGLIHQMRNTDGERMVSLHVYSPPLAATSVYRPYEQVLDFVI